MGDLAEGSPDHDGAACLKSDAGLADSVAVGISDRDYMRENDDAPERPELRPDLPWHSASRMSDEEYKGWLFQTVERPWFIIVVVVLLGLVGNYLLGDDVLHRFVDSFVGG